MTIAHTPYDDGNQVQPIAKDQQKYGRRPEPMFVLLCSCLIQHVIAATYSRTANAAISLRLRMNTRPSAMDGPVTDTTSGVKTRVRVRSL